MTDKSRILHFHPKKGKGVICLECAQMSMKEFNLAREATDPKYQATNPYHATWLDEWGPFPGPVDQACPHFRK